MATPTECTCGEGGKEIGICPYAEDVNNEITECECCPYCRLQCALDI